MLMYMAQIAPETITAISGAIVIVLGAAAAAIVMVIKALHDSKNIHAEMKDEAGKAKNAAVEAKTSAATGQQFIRGDLKVITDHLSRLDRKVTLETAALGKKVDGLGKDQKVQFEMIVELDKKMTQHIKDSETLGVR